MWYKLLPQTESLTTGMVNRQIVIDLRKCYSINLLKNCIEFRMDGGDMFTDDYETDDVAEEEYNDILAKLGAI